MIPVHNHSEYSALDGFSKPHEIANRISEIGLPGAFLTDHGTIAGLKPFYQAMKDKGLFAGFGMEAYQARYGRKVTINPETSSPFKGGEDSFHLVILAKNREGYLNLLRLSDEANRTGFYYRPRVDFELLERYKEGLIVTSSCMGSLINKRLEEGDESPIDLFYRIFRDNFLIEIHTYQTELQHELNKALTSIARERGIRMVYANDAHYAYPDNYSAHEALLCAQYGEKWGEPKSFKYPYLSDNDVYLHHPPCLYIMDEKDVRSHLSYLPNDVVDEAISTSDWLMKECYFELEPSSLHLPKFKKGNDPVDSAELLETLVVSGLEERYKEISNEILDRAQYEYESVVEAGLADYFLIVWDFIEYAKRHGIMVGPGRGSVGGSIMAYALGITNIDPIKFDLQFERFWNPGRHDGLPDIDVDYSQLSRPDMIKYAVNKYGENRVMPIGNHIFMHPKSAIDKAGMVLSNGKDGNPKYAFMKAVKKIIETTDDAGQIKTWDEVMEEVGDELSKYMEEDPLLFSLAKSLSGRLQAYGVHASAVVISDVDLPEHLPGRMASDSEGHRLIVTQAEMSQVEKEGFPKFDFLGLRNLDTIMRTAILSGDFGEDSREARIAVINHFWKEVDFDRLPESYWEFIDEGHTIGLFQIDESLSPRRIGKRLKPRSIEDLAAIIALNRPGPLRSGIVDSFLARRDGQEPITYPHEILAEVLEPTYGYFVYQEQVISYFRKIGYTLSEADYIRKILGKKLVDEMRNEYPRYLERATVFMSEARAKAIWESIEDFSKYSFNKSHAVGYGMILAWTLYAKARWPVEFIMASIETNPKRVGAYINEARWLGVNVRPPDINESGLFISKRGNDLIYGLREIKGIGNKVAQWVIDNRPFSSPYDLLDKIDKSKRPVFNRGHMKKMMEAGAFDGFGYRLVECDACGGSGRVKLKGERLLSDCKFCNAIGFVQIDIPDANVLAELEEEYLGIALTNAFANLIEKYSEEISELDDISMALDEEGGKKVVVPGIIKSVKKTKTRATATPRYANRDMAHVTISWNGEDVSFVAFPDVYDEFGFLLKENVLGKFTLLTNKRGPQLQKAFRFV